MNSLVKRLEREAYHYMRAANQSSSGERELPSLKYKKGDLVMVDENGKATKYEIVSVVETRRHFKDSEQLYEAKNTTTGGMKTIAEEDVLRRATPVDSSAELFEKGQPRNKAT
jgi:ribosomal 50S subunit-recycling heat shock protein